MRRQAPRPASEALRVAVARAAPKTTLAAVQTAWEEAVGGELAAHATPLRERGGELVVSCDSATWAEELTLMQGDLLRRLRERLGEAAPGQIRFVTGEPG
jgi:predicted nucleic acid-binding Zn ribbon protein